MKEDTPMKKLYMLIIALFMVAGFVVAVFAADRDDGHIRSGGLPAVEEREVCYG